MARYGQAFKDRAVARLLPPESAALDVVGREIGIGPETLQRWRDEVRARPERERVWSAGARLEAVIATAALAESSNRALAETAALLVLSKKVEAIFRKGEGE